MVPGGSAVDDGLPGAVVQEVGIVLDVVDKLPAERDDVIVHWVVQDVRNRGSGRLLGQRGRRDDTDGCCQCEYHDA